MEQHLVEWIGTFSYPAMFALLCAAGAGLPLSEELILLTGGLVAAKGGANLWAMMAVALAGVLVGDVLLYRLGRSLGPRATASKRLAKLLTPQRVAWVEGHFEKYGALTIFVARFLPGLRAPTYLIAGMSRLPRVKFFLADLCAAVITVPLLTYLGYRFGAAVLTQVRAVGVYLLLGAAVLIVTTAALKWVRRQRRLRSGEAAAAAQKLEHDLMG